MPPEANEWVSASDAARILGLHANTVRRSLADDEMRTHEWGAQGQGWRYKPLTRRREIQLRRSWVMRKAVQSPDTDEPG